MMRPGSVRRWAALAAALSALAVVVVLAPAAWLARSVLDATGGRLLLAEAQGSVWRGSAVAVLQGGAGSRDARALPGRLHWSLGLGRQGLQLVLRQDCCTPNAIRLQLEPGWGRWTLRLASADGGAAGAPSTLGRWPAAWLVGLGTPWNTLQPGGALSLLSSGFSVQQVQGRWLLDGSADLEWSQASSRVSAVEELGHYRLRLTGAAAQQQPPRVDLQTLSGALLLQGQGGWEGPSSRFRFNGTASAGPGHEAALGGLLNLIGRRTGAVSILSFG